MELRKFLSSTTELSNCEGPQDHVVLSSRVRLARNVTGRPFPGRAKKASRVETCEFIQPAIAAASAMRPLTVVRLAAIFDDRFMFRVL